MKITKILKTVCFGIMLVFISCNSIEDVKEGMTKKEVEGMLGKPNKTNSNSSSYTLSNGENMSYSKEEWKYNNQEGTIIFENGKVKEVLK